MAKSKAQRIQEILDQLAKAAAAGERWRLLKQLKRMSPPCHVYIIEAIDIGSVKIGIAHNIFERFSSIQACSPVKLKLHTHRQANNAHHARAIEKTIHAKLAEFRQHGEWFRVKADIAADALQKAFGETPNVTERQHPSAQ
jgi:hypothetical protein